MSISRRARTAGHHKRTQWGSASGVGVDFPNSLTLFKADIDIMAAAGQKWVRWGIPIFDVIADGDTSGISWNTTGLDLHTQAIDYARSKGVQVCIMLTGAEGIGTDASFADYLTMSNHYWTGMADRWKGKIGLWQLFNEVSGQHYQTFDEIPASAVGQNNFPAGYLSQLSQLIASGRNIIRTAQPGALISTPPYGFPISNDMQAEWEFFFDGIGGNNLDYISLHLYPDDSNVEIPLLPTRIAAMRNRYGKPVVVSEFGMMTSAQFTEANQGTYVPQMIAGFKAGGAKAGFLFALRDEEAGAEAAFGIIRFDGTQKSGYNAIMNAMR